MRFECHSTLYPKPFEPSHYIGNNLIDVWCHSDDGESVIAARVAVDYLDILRAVGDGQSILHVCDADSSAWMQVYESTMEVDLNFRGIREDFGFDDPVIGMAFIHTAAFHPSLNSWRSFIVDSICRMFPRETATVMWKHTTNLEAKDLASLGFRKVAGSEILFRPNMLENPYSALNDDRDPFDLTVPADAEDYVDEHWDEYDEFDDSSMHDF